MSSIKDSRGYNQGFKPSKSLKIRMERRAGFMLSRMALGAQTKILEIGCGTGEIAYLLAKKNQGQVVGLDIYLPFLEEAKKKYSLPNLHYERIDFNDPKNIDLISGGNKFDYIVGNGILHHLYYHLDEALSSMSLLLNDGGKLIFLEPNILNPYCLAIFNMPLFRKLASLDPMEMAFTKKFIVGKLTKAGYADIEVEYRDFLVPGIPHGLVDVVVALGRIAEKIPFIRNLSQSVYITAIKTGEGVEL